MKRIILMGKSGCGKTTLMQRLQNQALSYRKTQAADFSGQFIDTPGEYLEMRSLYRALITLACEADIVGLLQDADNELCWFPQGFAATFPKPIVGIVTKADLPGADPERAARYLREAGAEVVVVTSAVSGQGIEEVRGALGLEATEKG